MKFDNDVGDFVMDAEQLRKDDADNELDNGRMSKICLPAMNSINEDLKFNTEAPEDFPNKTLCCG